jgi:cytochrome b subunit of formate dehydrogenase
MTPRRKCVVAWALLFFFLIVVAGMVMNFKFPAWIANLSGIGSIFVFILWVLVFSCPRCGTPYLWEIRGHRRIGRFFPRRTCTVCGQPTDKPYVK